MKKMLSLLAISLSLSVGAAYAAGVPVASKAPSAKQLAQQEKMKACNKEAGEKAFKGAERKKFMSTCLKA